jgi:hypothetical protein
VKYWNLSAPFLLHAGFLLGFLFCFMIDAIYLLHRNVCWLLPSTRRYIPEAELFNVSCVSTPQTLLLNVVKKRVKLSCNRPWRPIGLWDVEASTFSRQSACRWRWDCQPYASAALYTPGRFLVLISVTGRVDLRDTVRLEDLGKLKNPMASSEIEPATFRLVA